MADSKKLSPVVRLWDENIQELEPLAKLGINYGNVVNQALKDNHQLRKAVEKRLKSLKAALAEV